MAPKPGKIRSGILIQVNEVEGGNLCEVQPYGDLFTIKANVIGYLQEHRGTSLPYEKIVHLENRPISFVVHESVEDGKYLISITAP